MVPGSGMRKEEVMLSHSMRILLVLLGLLAVSYRVFPLTGARSAPVSTYERSILAGNSGILIEDLVWSFSTNGIFSLRLEISSHAFFTASLLTGRELKTCTWTKGTLQHHVSSNVRGLPMGSYNMKLGPFTQACYTSEEVVSDFFDSNSLPTTDFCTGASHIVAKLSIRGQMDQPTCKTEDVFRSGYWKNMSEWYPSSCKLKRSIQSPLARRKPLIIYLAGDSVVRGMFPLFCDAINAYRRSHVPAKDYTGVKRSQCCTGTGHICLIWRFTWFSLEKNSMWAPSTFKQIYPSRSAWCDGHKVPEACEQMLSSHAFNWTKSRVEADIIHWQFYGSHSDGGSYPVFGASNSSCNRLVAQGDVVDQYEQLYVFGTPAVVESLLPKKFVTTQVKTRTNLRISRRNAELKQCLGPRFIDLFPVTFALPEEQYSDTVHFIAAYPLVANLLTSVLVV